MVENVHERLIEAPLSLVGGLIDGLASRGDQLWPRERWPPMRFDRPLGVGAVGGHGPIRYRIEAYEPGRMIRFRFTAPRGFIGTHGLDAEETAPGVVRLRHRLTMRLRGMARLSWPLIFRPLHDALIEDALDCAAAEGAGESVQQRQWSRRVSFLRWLLGSLKRKGVALRRRELASARVKGKDEF